ncbi:MAG: tRNA-dihydrouridine synthase, partial [Ottowia sp.]|nr:tRNA-dihydrouridine synthase [Ottowia sp.]
LAPPLVLEVRRALLEHLQDHYGLYGEWAGVRSARKHIGWYVRGLPGGEALRRRINPLEDAAAQTQAVGDYFSELAQVHERLPLAATTLEEVGPA